MGDNGETSLVRSAKESRDVMNCVSTFFYAPLTPTFASISQVLRKPKPSTFAWQPLGNPLPTPCQPLANPLRNP